jgi:hypothetical protein
LRAEARFTQFGNRDVTTEYSDERAEGHGWGDPRADVRCGIAGVIERVPGKRFSGIASRGDFFEPRRV